MTYTSDCCLHTVFVCQNLFVTIVGVVVPCTGVHEGLRVSSGFGADVVANLVAIAVGIKQVKINKINRRALDVFPQNLQIIAV